MTDVACLSRYTEIFVFAPETSYRISDVTDVTELSSERAMQHNPAVPETCQVAIGLGQFRKGNDRSALQIVKEGVPRPDFAYWAIATAVYAKALQPKPSVESSLACAE
jgi:hypothetical protein